MANLTTIFKVVKRQRGMLFSTNWGNPIKRYKNSLYITRYYPNRWNKFQSILKYFAFDSRESAESYIEGYLSYPEDDVEIQLWEAIGKDVELGLPISYMTNHYHDLLDDRNYLESLWKIYRESKSTAGSDGIVWASSIKLIKQINRTE